MTNDVEIIVSLEGGGTRSQAAVMDGSGQLLGEGASRDVNTNFVPFAKAQAAVLEAVNFALQAADLKGNAVKHFAVGLVGPRFGPETFGILCPHASYHYYKERDVVFARAGIYQPHGVALVAATGASAFGVRSDDNRQVMAGGWGSLLGDEGSAYAIGLQALRGAGRAFEGRLEIPTRMVAAVCMHFGLDQANFRHELVQLAYQKPLSRAEIASLAPRVVHLAQEDDLLARRILEKAANDLASLTLFVAQKLFYEDEVFDVVTAGGLVRAGEPVLGALRGRLAEAFPQAILRVGTEEPAVALGRLALYELSR